MATLVAKVLAAVKSGDLTPKRAQALLAAQRRIDRFLESVTEKK